jgi:catalase
MPPIAPCYFLPAALPAGIEPADPMITARNEAYPISYARRHGDGSE